MSVALPAGHPWDGAVSSSPTVLLIHPCKPFVSQILIFFVCVTVRDENGVSSKVQCAAPSLMRCLGGARSLQKLEGFE